MGQPVQAALRAGTLTGVREASGVCRYSAIPYAQAPVGSLRFAPPQPPTWRGERDATRAGRYRHNCPRGCARPWAISIPRNPKTACT
ncbi:Carboxylesterase family [Achromobacter denitrificans]|nr:Carboxylesterase family [Achromobacter denitrificans]